MTASALVAALTLWSLSFAGGAAMPGWTAHGEARCPGADRSPELRWSHVPAGTRSLAIILYDSDASWYHWVAYDLPPTLRALSPGAALPSDRLGTNSFGERRYGGPCPPPGPAHHYIFTLYALNTPSIAGARPLDGPSALARIRGHIIASARLVGRYGL
jgi:Raf kinase inhibitor-like YbhB/YbcL family protein